MTENKTVYWYDTAFVEHSCNQLDLISIGIVSNDGREYYAVNSDMPMEYIKRNPWLMENVWSQLPIENRLGGGEALDRTSAYVKPPWVIRNEVRAFLLAKDPPELWADYAAHDHVVLTQLFGSMAKLPIDIPMWTHDLQQFIELLPHFKVPEQVTPCHNALNDAMHTKLVYQKLTREFNDQAEVTEPDENTC